MSVQGLHLGFTVRFAAVREWSVSSLEGWKTRLVLGAQVYGVLL